MRHPLPTVVFLAETQPARFESVQRLAEEKSVCAGIVLDDSTDADVEHRWAIQCMAPFPPDMGP